MTFRSDSDYQEAVSLLPTVRDPAVKKRLANKIAIYESEQGVEGGDTSISGTTAPEQLPAQIPPPEAPKPGPEGMWMPQRPLATMDYVPQDVGGKLAIWRDMPLEVYKSKVLLPQREMTIAAGQKAMMELQRYGAGAFSPEDMVQRTMLIAQGKAAEAQDPDTIDENDPGFKQFNDQQWQQAVQQRQQDPEAGPIQRLEKVDTSSFMGKLAYGGEKAKDYLQAGARGALDMATLGLGTGAIDAVTEAVSGREAVDVSRGLEEAHPITAGLGGAAMAMARPTLGGAGIMRGIYGSLVPRAGRLGAAVASGAAGTAAEGLGRDLSAEAADALSDAPGAVLERGRLDPERLATNTAVRGGLGAAFGAAGHGVTRLGEGVANKISEMAIKGTGGRTPYEAAEAAGYEFDPILGIRVPQSVKDQKAATRLSGVPWAEDFGARATPGVIENVDKFHVAEKAAMGHENLAYHKSVQGKKTPISDLSRELSVLDAQFGDINPEAMGRASKIVRTFSPVMSSSKMGDAMERLSNEAEKAAAGRDTQAAEIFKRLQAALMQDMKRLPKGNLEGRLAEGPNGETLEGWPALRAEHADRKGFIDEIRFRSGDRENLSPEDAAAAVNKALMDQGKRGFPVARERVLDRFMPPELKQESMLLRAANMMDEVDAGKGAAPYPSRAGVIDWVSGKLQPRAYGLGRAVSRPVDSYPVSDKMFAWVNARIPRATMFVPGMDLTKAVQQLSEMQNRPKKWGDLTPEQQELLLGALGTEDQKEVLQETSP